MTETIAQTLEYEHQTATMPVGQELRAAYLPVCQEAIDSLSVSSQGPADESAASQMATRAASRTWWQQLPGELKRYGVDPATADNLQLAARHSVDFDYKGEATGQGFTVFEIGEQEEDREAIDTVVRTLELIDQWSGGLLAASPNRLNVALTNGFRLHSTQYKNNDGSRRQTAGLAYDNMILISMPYIKDLVAEYPGMDFHNLLATTVVHEVLGHRVEGTVEGDTGTYFRKHFQYSDSGPGNSYPKIFRVITSKDGVIDTHPVREYGSTGAVEDVATSIDSTVAAAMGWELTNRNSPRFANTPDAHRDELVMQLLDTGAKLAKERGYTGVPGYVGSEVYYDVNNQPQPARNVHTTVSYGEDALQQELRAIVAASSSSRR